jgi:DNA-binding FadR family transcriptional regulator
MADDATMLAALKAARNSGALTVRHGDTMTTFRSLAEMDQIISDLIKATAITPPSRIRYVYQLRKAL